MQTVDVIEDIGKYHRRIYVFLPENRIIKQIIYFHGTPGDGKGMAEKLWERMKPQMTEADTGIVMLEVEDWNRDLSPWYARGIFFKGEDFAGGGKDYLLDLCGQVIPEIERQYQHVFSIERRIIGGYSMGGLFALYAMCESSLFTDLISVSGSLWYDGLKTYISEHICGKRDWRAYFSLGRNEPKTRNSRMRMVGEQTIAIQEMLGQQGISTYFEWNPGNHFQDVPERIEKGIRYMLDVR